MTACIHTTTAYMQVVAGVWGGLILASLAWAWAVTR